MNYTIYFSLENRFYTYLDIDVSTLNIYANLFIIDKLITTTRKLLYSIFTLFKTYYILNTFKLCLNNKFSLLLKLKYEFSQSKIKHLNITSNTK